MPNISKNRKYIVKFWMKTFVNLNSFYINPQSINHQQKVKKDI